MVASQEWSEADLRRLKLLYATEGVHVYEIAKMLHRTSAAIQHRVYSLGLKRSKPSTKPKSVWADPDKEAYLVKTYPHKSNKAIAQEMGMSVNQITNKAADLSLVKTTEFMKQRYRGVKFFDEWPGHERYDGAMRIYADPIAIASDVHFPIYSPEALNKLMMASVILGAKTLVLVGDVLDMHAFSPFPDKGGKLPNDLKSLEVGLVRLLSIYEHIYFLMGNHEARLFKATSHQINATLLGKMLTNDPRIEISEYEYATLYTKGKIPWTLVHADKTRKMQLSLPDELTRKTLTNVIVCGDHMVNFGIDRGGHFMISQIGHCSDQFKARYKNIRVTTHSEWMNGFAIIKNGAFYQFAEDSRITDWGFWQGLYKKRRR